MSYKTDQGAHVGKRNNRALSIVWHPQAWSWWQLALKIKRNSSIMVSVSAGVEVVARLANLSDQAAHDGE